jgi:hypothetical protein
LYSDSEGNHFDQNFVFIIWRKANSAALPFIPPEGSILASDSVRLITSVE